MKPVGWPWPVGGGGGGLLNISPKKKNKPQRPVYATTEVNTGIFLKNGMADLPKSCLGGICLLLPIKERRRQLYVYFLSCLQKIRLSQICRCDYYFWMCNLWTKIKICSYLYYILLQKVTWTFFRTQFSSQQISNLGDNRAPWNWGKRENWDLADPIKSNTQIEVSRVKS